MSAIDTNKDGWISASENPLTGMSAPSIADISFNNSVGSLSAKDAVDFNYNDINSWKEELYRRFKNGDDAAGERLFNYLAQEEANKNSLDYAKNAYSYMLEDLKKAGISPYIISGASPLSMSFGSSSGSQMTTQSSSLRSAQTANKDRINDDFLQILKTIGIVAAALIYSH